MRLFKNKIRNSAASDKAAGRIANSILKVQRKFADVLEKKSMSWKAKQKWIFLYMVCLVFGGLSVIAIMKPFKSRTPDIPRPSSIKIPGPIDENKNEPSITDNEIRQVHLFKHNLDSLSKTEEGKTKVDGLLKRRPGLMDSLEMVEQLYYSQKK